MKCSGLSKVEKQDEDSEDESDDDEVAEPILESKEYGYAPLQSSIIELTNPKRCRIPLTSATNRVRIHQIPSSNSSTQSRSLAATMLESKQVLIFDVAPHLASFDNPGVVVQPKDNKPLCTIRAHSQEGYALDWSLLVPGKLLTGRSPL